MRAAAQLTAAALTTAALVAATTVVNAAAPSRAHANQVETKTTPVASRASTSTVMFHGPARIGGKKAIYLTFDDGPADSATIAVARALQSRRVKATFFAVGSRAATASGRRALRYLTNAGMPVGMHSWNHADMHRWSSDAVRADLTRTATAIKRATGASPTCFRPPYGANSRTIIDVARVRRIGVPLWDVDTRDWTSPGSRVVAQRVLSHLHPGAIVLMHDGSGHGHQAAAALPQIIKGALDRGYTFGTICPMNRA